MTPSPSEWLGWTCAICGRQNTHPAPPNVKRGETVQLSCHGCSRSRAVVVGWNIFPDRRRKPRLPITP